MIVIVPINRVSIYADESYEPAQCNTCQLSAFIGVASASRAPPDQMLTYF